MRISDDRLNYLSHQIVDILKGRAVVADEAKTLSGVKKSMREFGELIDAIDGTVRKKIESLKRNVPEGSREWDLLYRQYADEELAKKGL